MTSISDDLADAACQFIGAPFKLGGCSPDTGLDCVGLVVCSLHLIGRDTYRPSGYRLRNASIDQFLTLAELNGFQPSDSKEQRGDLVLVRPGPAQHHLAIANGDGRYVHAHAGLRKTAITQLPEDWTALNRWRLTI